MSSEQRIRVSDANWRRLNSKKLPGESFDDVVDRLLDDTSSAQKDE